MKLCILPYGCEGGLKFTLDLDVIDMLFQASEEDKLDYSDGYGMSSGEFDYYIVEVPDGSTPASLNIDVINKNDLKRIINE